MNKSSGITSGGNEINLNDSGPIRIISSRDIQDCLSMKDAIGLMSKAFASFTEKECYVPPRIVTEIPGKDMTLIYKPAYMHSLGSTGIKILSQNEQNINAGIPTIMGMFLLLDGETGRFRALMDGSYLTALRTGAASGLASEYLAREDSSVLAIFGCGTQGRTQLEAINSVRKLERVYIYDVNRTVAEMFLKDMKKRFDLEIFFTDDLKHLKNADIICTATGSRKPLFGMDHIKEGVHINAIGSYKPDMQEIDPEIIMSSRLFVDSIESCIRESGDLIIPLREGIISEDHILGEIGSIVLGRTPGRKSDREITVFKSVGIAIQDLVVANEAYKRLIQIKR